MAIRKMKVVCRVGPCGDPTAIVHGVVRGGGKGGTSSGMWDSETRSGVGLIGLIGAFGSAEVLAHLLKGESALGDVGRAEPTAGIALYESLGEKKVCDSLSPRLDVLLGLQARWSD